MAVRTCGKIGHNRESNAGNKYLVCALIFSIVVMIGLACLNLRYVKISSPTLEIAHPSLPAFTDQQHDTEENCPTTSPASTGVPINKPSSPEVTFYERLTSQEDKTTRETIAPGATSDSNHPTVRKTNKSSTSKHQNTSKKKGTIDHAWKAPATSNGRSYKPINRKDQASKPALSRKRYRILVGTFSQPSIAEQRTRTLKTKGFRVKLKPVAKPGKGVFYQIWSMKISSETQAKALAQRLKSSEGLQKVKIVAVN
jgi:cell division septation protein DedD